MTHDYTYRHKTAFDMLGTFKVSSDFVFSSAEECRAFVDRCLDDQAPDYVVIQGEWAEGLFTGSHVVD